MIFLCLQLTVVRLAASLFYRLNYDTICNHLYCHSVFASSSEDTTIKLWDYETVQYERTLKGSDIRHLTRN